MIFGIAIARCYLFLLPERSIRGLVKRYIFYIYDLTVIDSHKSGNASPLTSCSLALKALRRSYQAARAHIKVSK